MLKQYEKNASLYWYIWISWLIYAIAFVVYIAVFMNNVSFLYSYTYNPGAPGELVSLRYNFQWAMLFISLIGNMLILLLIPISIAYRYDYGCTVVTWIFYFLGLGLLIFALIGLGVYYGSANQQDQFGNLFNSLVWCCVNEIWMNPANKCPNSLGCDPPVVAEDLSPEGTMVAIFWFLFSFVIINIIYVIVIFSVQFGSEDSLGEVVPLEPKKQVESRVVYNANAVPSGKLSGLRKRE